jgi:hypothetical protein
MLASSSHSIDTNVIPVSSCGVPNLADLHADVRDSDIVDKNSQGIRKKSVAPLLAARTSFRGALSDISDNVGKNSQEVGRTSFRSALSDIRTNAQDIVDKYSQEVGRTSFRGALSDMHADVRDSDIIGKNAQEVGRTSFRGAFSDIRTWVEMPTKG